MRSAALSGNADNRLASVQTPRQVEYTVPVGADDRFFDVLNSRFVGLETHECVAPLTMMVRRLLCIMDTGAC